MWVLLFSGAAKAFTALTALVSLTREAVSLIRHFREKPKDDEKPKP